VGGWPLGPVVAGEGSLGLGYGLGLAAAEGPNRSNLRTGSSSCG